MNLLRTLIPAAIACALTMPVLAEPLNEEQGAAILQELKAIRGVLERLERQGGLAKAPTRAAPSARVKVGAKGAASLGAEDAPLTLVEFTDYQCPYCRRFVTQVLPTLKSKYIETGKVRLVVRDLPLSFHQHAQGAALAARCAADQDAYWPMHDVLFQNAKRLNAEHLPGYAAQIGLDMQRFEPCLADERHKAAVASDIRAAGAAAITGTPTFVLGTLQADGTVDGIRIRGAQPLANFERHIETLLAQRK